MDYTVKAYHIAASSGALQYERSRRTELDRTLRDGRQQAQRSSGQKNRRRRRKIKGQVFVFLALLLIGVLAALTLTVLFPVKEITVTGETRYSEEEIINVSALTKDENLFAADTEIACERITKQLPYIGSVKVNRVLPGTLSIEVTEAVPKQVYRKESTYLLCNESGKILEIMQKIPEDNKYTVISGAEIESSAAGETLTIKDDEQKLIIQSLQDQFSAIDMKLTYLDVSDTVNIGFVLSDRLIVEFGTKADLEYKVAHLNGMIQSMKADDMGKIDMKWWTVAKTEAYFTDSTPALFADLLRDFKEGTS